MSKIDLSSQEEMAKELGVSERGTQLARFEDLTDEMIRGIEKLKEKIANGKNGIQERISIRKVQKKLFELSREVEEW